VNVWIQSPVYVFMAVGELFAYVTAMEYAYEQSPKDMKAIVQAISLLIGGVASGCAMGLTPIARDPYLVILYGSLTGAMTVTTALFWWLFSKYDKLEIHGADNSFTAEMATPPIMNTASTPSAGGGGPHDSGRVPMERTDGGLGKGIVVRAVAGNGGPETPVPGRNRTISTSMQREGDNIHAETLVHSRSESLDIVTKSYRSVQNQPPPARHRSC
jgi:hypothetical protein